MVRGSVPGIFTVGKARPVRKPDNLTAICEPGSSTSHNPIGFHGLQQGQLYFTFIPVIDSEGP
jgi:hypothetical protein